MSTLRVLIDRDNAAFGWHDDHLETARILRELADRIEQGTANLEHGYALRDVNGNTVGRAQVVTS